MTIAARQQDDTPELWAAITHKLRQAAPQYDEATALPLPLHLAQAVKEYVLLTDAAEDTD